MRTRFRYWSESGNGQGVNRQRVSIPLDAVREAGSLGRKLPFPASQNGVAVSGHLQHGVRGLVPVVAMDRVT